DLAPGSVLRLEIARPRQPGVTRLGHHGDPALADVVADGVAGKIVTDVVAVGYPYVLVHDGPLHAGSLSHIDVVEQDRVAHLGALLDPDVAAEHAVLDEAAGDHAAARHD